MRFEYEPPSPLLVVADGLWLVLYDKEIGQVHRFPLYGTPLGVLVAETVDLYGASGRSGNVSRLPTGGSEATAL